MNQQVFYNNRIPLILMALMLLVTGFISSASADKGAEPQQSDTGFKILHHQPFSFNAPQIAGDALSRSANQESEGTTNLVFEAFGISFDLILQSNQQLISNLPLKQQQELNQSIKLYRGKLRGNDDSWARLTVHGNLVSGMIWDGKEMYVIDNPAEIAGALGSGSAALSADEAQQPASSLIYRLADTETGEQSCTTAAPNGSALETDSFSASDYAGLVQELQANIVGQAAATLQLDVAVVGDPEFVERHNNPTTAVIARMNVVDGIFSEQVGVQINLTEIKLLTDSSILTKTDFFGLMLQFNDFVGSPAINNPGLTHLFTGRDLDGSTIGFAWLGALCRNSDGTGLSQIRGSGVAGALTVAHELGHNFGAPHDSRPGACSGTPRGFIMFPTLDGSDTFSDCSVRQMRPHIARAACILDIEAPTGTDLRLILSQSNIVVDAAGQDFAFQVEVKNSGQRTALNASAFITLPDGLLFQEATVDGGSCQINSNNVIQCDIDDINAGSLKTVAVKLQASEPGSFSINVEIAADNDNSPLNNRATVTVNVDTNIPPPPPPPETETDVAVELPAQVSGVQNKPFNLSVDVKNTGDEKAINVLVDIPLSNGIEATFASINGGICTIETNLVSCNMGVIEGNSLKTVNLILQASNVGSFVIDVAISASNDSNSANNTAQTTVDIAPPPPPPPANTDVLIFLPETQLTVQKGKSFKFLVEVKNVGLGTARRVLVRVPIEKGMYARRIKTIIGRGQCIGGITVSCSLGNMGPNTSRTISVEIQANNEGEFDIDAMVRSSNDSNPDNNKSQAIVNVVDESVPSTTPPTTVPPTTSGLIEAHFDKGLDGFVYIDDAFRNTSQPAYAHGNRSRRGGFSRGGLRVVTGKGRRVPETTMSGGFKRTFSLENATAVTLSFRYKLTQGRNFNEDEFSEALVSIDDELMSPQAGIDYLARIQGDGRGGRNQTTGWQVVTLDLGVLSAGEHNLIIGESSNRTGGRRKMAYIDIDDVVMTPN